jgi:DNA-binding XRE family transcriptional regulator
MPLMTEFARIVWHGRCHRVERLLAEPSSDASATIPSASVRRLASGRRPLDSGFGKKSCCAAKTKKLDDLSLKRLGKPLQDPPTGRANPPITISQPKKAVVHVKRQQCYTISVTPAQCRAARALLDWTQDDLSQAAEVGVVTIRQFERGATEPRRAILIALRRALEDAGVRFINANKGGGPGVRLREDRP